MNANTYFEWMKNIHDWCLSRQLWWGHRIPAWYCGACGKMSVAMDAPEACHGCGITDIRQETDVLDTWFSSALLPFTVFDWDSNNTLTPALQAFYPTDLLVTGFDILFFWVARMIMLGSHFMLDVPSSDGSPRTLAEAVPFREVYIHGLVRDANREKMSKTKGNVIDPIGVIEQYGTDAVRFTLAAQASPGTDIAFNEARTEGYRAFANKVWNAARFIAIQIERGREAGYPISLSANTSSTPEKQVLRSAQDDSAVNVAVSPLETRWIFSRLATVCVAVDKALADFRFDEAANAVYQFFWGEFCDWYVELVKLRLDFNVPRNETASRTLSALVQVFEAALRLLSPFMPFLTEELWHALHAQLGAETPAKSIALTRYPQAADFAVDDSAVADMTGLQELIVTVRALRKELSVPEKEAAPVQVRGSEAFTALARTNAEMLARLARVKTVEIVSVTPQGNNARSTASFDVAVMYERQIDVPAERERLGKELAKLTKGVEAAERQLNNAGFVAKAPPHIVEGLKKQSAETRTLKEKAEAALAALPLA